MGRHQNGLDSVENHAWAPCYSRSAAAPRIILLIHTHASRVRYLCKGNGKCVIVIVAGSLARYSRSSQANSYYNKTPLLYMKKKSQKGSRPAAPRAARATVSQRPSLRRVRLVRPTTVRQFAKEQVARSLARSRASG